MDLIGPDQIVCFTGICAQSPYELKPSSPYESRYILPGLGRASAVSLFIPGCLRVIIARPCPHTCRLLWSFTINRRRLPGEHIIHIISYTDSAQSIMN